MVPVWVPVTVFITASRVAWLPPAAGLGPGSGDQGAAFVGAQQHAQIAAGDGEGRAGLCAGGGVDQRHPASEFAASVVVSSARVPLVLNGINPARPVTVRVVPVWAPVVVSITAIRVVYPVVSLPSVVVIRARLASALNSRVSVG